jgi:hypothetical protein
VISYVREDGARSARLVELVVDPWDLDPEGVAAAWGERPDRSRTVFRGIRRECALGDEAVGPESSSKQGSQRGGASAAPALAAAAWSPSPGPDRAPAAAPAPGSALALALAVAPTLGPASRPRELADPSAALGAADVRREPGLEQENLERLLDVVAAQLPVGVTVALSGGVDAALLLAIAARAGLRPEAVTLVTGLEAYDEAEAAEATARALGVPWRPVRVSVDEVLAAWPAAVEVAGWPLYNLHPVARGLLVRAVAGEGVGDLVTGDGVDARLAGMVDHLYLPAVAPLLTATPCRVGWPLAAALASPDPGKARLRAWAEALGVPAAVAYGPKTPRWFPEVGGWRDPARLDRLAARLGRPLAADGAAWTGWTSLDLLVRAAEAA